ncbi:surface-adhesin E family protein [Methylobacillus rhizosphaerae]|uniref:surface-adhesin E family protein n=1 Tax=Methylobacillus rhizosphaerae TaxID=551994 RepID=UPI00117E2513|nr:surface-adhesin E family protein [Methylobacillus rhizosphaerae]
MATEWEPLIESQATSLSIDSDSYAENGIYSSMLAKLETEGVPRTIKHMRLEFDCRKQLYRTLETTFFDAQGKLLRQSSNRTALQPVQLDEHANVMADLVCQVRRMVNPLP